MRHVFRAIVLVVAALGAAAAHAEETIDFGGVGGASATSWAHYIAQDKDFYANEGIKVDLTYLQSSAAAMQALTSNSINMSLAIGFSDPFYAYAAGASVAIIRIDGQVGPFALEANSKFKTLKDLKGHLVSVDEAKGNTMVFLSEMLTANGMTRSDFDFVYAGSTGARFAALKSGAVSAAMLGAPQLFVAELQGFVNLGYVYRYAPDLPFTADLVNRTWAAGYPATIKKFLAAYSKAIAWFYDPQNRAAAIGILVNEAHMSADDVGKSYDFFQRLKFFDPSNRVSVSKVTKFYDALHALDPSLTLDPAKVILQLD